MRFPIRSFATVVLALVASATQAAGQCPRAHCQARIEPLVQACTENAQAGNLVFLDRAKSPGGSCHCECGGFAIDTPVAIDAGESMALDRIEAGASVLALGRDGQWRPTLVALGRRHRQPGRPMHRAIHVEVANGTTIVTTAGHVFLLGDRSTLRRADRLQPGDELLDARTLAPVAIERIEAATYQGAMRNLGVVASDAGPGPWGHLLDTAGLVSGDYSVQLAGADADAGPAAQAGSGSWSSLHARAPDGVAPLRFVSGPRTPIPSDAIPFLPPGEDRAAAGKLRPLDDPAALAMAEYLLNKYQRAYPEVVFQLAWENDKVNAVVHKDGDVRTVTIMGGAFRHVDMGAEGAGLILAHELGHHFGGEPKSQSAAHAWASCEGQADYWGAAVAQRNVWWGPQAVENTRKGARQLYRVMTGGLAKPGAGSATSRATGLCGNPPPTCRRDTYLAGNRLDPKPACAGDPPGSRR
jgi:hypothetical protein